ncbi:transcription elongation factor SPT4 [Salpingoeca rosetta]|uniref:Transcription elongation factor SPT4 n=1 Tax=Salpingoeca rosetta (strain ATCC 50818 / BSB-021) TaxID=946362 RepID=F2U6Z8_SALR5|nr:transcription elongation factor SPT4 [Salpingoeca rosetta]EGD83630.1 transcription elongation factor SPT4 [Salpingoeca rosetta]|eukprot:XP_004995134.1 transcription elongation factor SPT4 [Salpingoeca rosetta]
MAEEVVNPMDICPAQTKKLRACIACGLVKTSQQFVENGCENCEEFLGLKGNPEGVETCTSGNFHGIIALIEPGDSWVARAKRLGEVTGSLADDAVKELPEPIRQRYLAEQQQAE